MLLIITLYWRRGQAAIKRGVTLVKLKRVKAVQEIVKMKFTVPNDAVEDFDRLAARLERGIDQLEAIYA
jgi:V/A-type H+-transporting ATPase subunit A